MRREVRKKIKKYERISALLDYIGIPVSVAIVIVSFTLFTVSKLLGFLVMGAGFLTLVGVVTASVLFQGKSESVAVEEHYHKLEEKLRQKQQSASNENVIVEDFVNENDNHEDSQIITNMSETNNTINNNDDKDIEL